MHTQKKKMHTKGNIHSEQRLHQFEKGKYYIFAHNCWTSCFDQLFLKYIMFFHHEGIQSHNNNCRSIVTQSNSWH